MRIEKASNRLVGIDLIKVIACFLVIVLHTCFTLNDSRVTISSIMYYTGVMAIPLFFMANGYLLFGKSRKDKWYSYKKIGRILLLAFIYCVIISIYNGVMYHQFLNPFSEMLSNLFFAEGYLWFFWFFGALILIYLIFPAIDYLYLHKLKYFFIFSGFLILAQCLVDFLNIYFSVEYNDLFQLHISQPFRLESHLSYFVLGGVIKLLKPRIQKYAKLRNVLLLYVLAIVYQFFMIKNFYPINYCEFFYDNIIIIGLCSLFFIYISNIQKTKWDKEISLLASLVMVTYIFHHFVIIAYGRFAKIVGLDFLYIFIIKLIFVYIATSLLSWVLLKNPYLKEILKI